MEKRTKLIPHVGNLLQWAKESEKIKALEKDLEAKKIGKIDDKTLEIVFDQKDENEVAKLMEKHLL